jgi:aminocarboxymuconate-semialdehyde decarboxylase
MQEPQLAVEEMTRCLKDLHFKGIQIGSHINDWNLDQKELYPIWKVCLIYLFVVFIS